MNTRFARTVAILLTLLIIFLMIFISIQFANAGTPGSGGATGDWEWCETREDDGDSSLYGKMRSTLDYCEYAINATVDVKLWGQFYITNIDFGSQSDLRVYAEGPGCSRRVRVDLDYQGHADDWKVQMNWCDTNSYRTYFDVWAQDLSSVRDWYWTDIGWMVADEEDTWR